MTNPTDQRGTDGGNDEEGAAMTAVPRLYKRARGVIVRMAAVVLSPWYYNCFHDFDDLVTERRARYIGVRSNKNNDTCFLRDKKK